MSRYVGLYRKIAAFILLVNRPRYHLKISAIKMSFRPMVFVFGCMMLAVRLFAACEKQV